MRGRYFDSIQWWQSCEAIRTVLDHFEGEKHIENFVNEYGTGNTVTLTPAFEPQSDPTTEPKPVIKLAEFSRTRKTGQQRRPLMANSIIVSTTSTNGTSSGPSTSAAPPPTQAPPPPKQQNKNLLPPSRSGTIRRSSQPLPEQPVIQGRDPVPSPRPPEHLGGGILFYGTRFDFWKCPVSLIDTRSSQGFVRLYCNN